MEANAPKKISKYDVVDLIGTGGMGVVYKAVDRALGRLVAIKLVTGAAEPGELLKRFYREARFTANLRHPNIVIVYDLGDFEGRPYLVMEYLDGQSLESMLATKTITMLQKISYVRQICSGLEYAHSRQPSIIHRDIKPANIVVLADGSVKIVDFGIARLVHSRHTRAGQLMGSFHYMSPEQINGVDLDGRSDIFSTGVLLYQLLTSKLPFEGRGIAQTLNRIVFSPAPPLSQVIQGYPPALDHILARALAKERDERYPSASEFSFDLLEVEKHLKSSLFGEYISRAERLLRDGQLDRAKQELLNVLEIDREHVRANELMRQVVQSIAKKQGCLEEAIRREKTNTEPQAAGDQAIAARARREKLNEVLSRAERAYSAGDLEGASRAVDEAFELDPDGARAKSLNVQIAHKVAEHGQERRVQELLALARRHISARKFADALEAVNKAQSLNPVAPGIPDLMALAASGHEREQRRRVVEKAAAEIFAALDGSDPSLAYKLAQAAVQQFPNEGTFLQLKARAERGRQAWVAEQLTSARALLGAGRNTDALAVVEAACRRCPGEGELDSLMAIVRARIQREETERRKAEITAKAEHALKRKNYSEAVQLLESAKSEMKTGDFDELLQLAREEETRFEWKQKVDAAAAQAQRFIDSGEYAQAAEFLDSAARELSSEDLRILAVSTRRQWEDYRQELDELMAKANHLLEAGRPANAAACLEVKAAIYGREPSFQSGLQQARQQRAAAMGKAAMAIRALVSSGNLNEARLQLTAAHHDFGDVRELRELEADIDQQQVHAIHKKVEATLREAEDLIRFKAGAQALATLQSVDDLLDKVPPGLRKRHDELKIAVNALLEEVKQEQMRYAAARELDPLKPELSIPGSWKSELKTPGDGRPGPSDAATTIGFGSRLGSADRKAESCDQTVMLTPPAGTVPQEPTPAQGRIAAELGSSSPGRQRRPETMPLKVASPLGRSSSRGARRSSHKPVESDETLLSLSQRSNSGAQSPDLPKANPATAYTSISGWGDDVLKKVEIQLATFLGPLARILVKRGACKTTDLEELYRLLAANLEQDSDRRAFLARRAEIAYGGTKRQTIREPLSSANSGTSATPGSTQEITPAAIDHAARVLAHYVGPISGDLAKKAAQRADSLRTLYLLLAEHVKSKQERARFLRDAGFPSAKGG
ncbi:MAG TPA: protein kinase [Terriglobales bacterium]|nr:protein kinase [Terriglobales bacterium]